ncbi:hypothetical protein L1987_08671 [Smallanthus sonchifolius]|uniref:Uncharacterized protein n=1 Tax=Smallanthus sonchifolius TaxID=185202 RepID=A0ACB9JLB8_9ASTR|nr:hypothetical protein L1987_08671 [Smallanthus sonchifolius]
MADSPLREEEDDGGGNKSGEDGFHAMVKPRVGFSALLQGYCQAGYLDDAIDACNEMVMNGIVCYSVIINGTLKQGDAAKIMY